VPLFEVDDDRSVFGLLKQWADFGTGGWWHGTAHTKANVNFVPEVQKAVPASAPGVLVACQTGVRSLAASEQLRRAGYTNIAWCVPPGISPMQRADGHGNVQRAGVAAAYTQLQKPNVNVALLPGWLAALTRAPRRISTR
jgi:rhodanese-related sulfurtransferase